MKSRIPHAVVGIGCSWLALAGAIPTRAQEIIELPAEDRTLELEFEELYRLGTLAGEEWEQFGHVQSVAFDPSGNLLVFDRLLFEFHGIFLVGPDGRLIREIGRPGEGPGEFGDAVATAVLADGRVVVADLSRRGYHLFGADGEFERLVRMSGTPAAWRLGPIRAQPRSDAIISVPGQATSVIIGGGALRGPIVVPSSLTIERTNLSGEWSETDTVAVACCRRPESRIWMRTGNGTPFTHPPTASPS